MPQSTASQTWEGGFRILGSSQTPGSIQAHWGPNNSVEKLPPQPTEPREGRNHRCFMPVRIGVICYTALDNAPLLASSSSSVKGTSSPHLEDLFCILANFLDAEMLVVWKKKSSVCLLLINLKMLIKQYLGPPGKVT